nr:anti-sigma factor [Bacillus massiliglaciei]
MHEDFIEYMHDYLDDDISEEHRMLLKDHLLGCEGCREYFHEMKKAVALVQSTSHVKAPEGFTANVLAKLPKENKKAGARRWFKNHPLMTAAAVFLLLMTGSVFSTYNQEDHFSVSKQPNLVVEGETVIVPEHETVKGDVVVRNGDIRIEGKVEGDVTVINGHEYTASAGSVTGNIKEIDQAFEWMWFKIKNTAQSVVSDGEKDK